MTTVDHKDRHIWARTPAGIRCAFMGCDAKPEPAEVARLEAEEARRRARRIEVRWTH